MAVPTFGQQLLAADAMRGEPVKLGWLAILDRRRGRQRRALPRRHLPAAREGEDCLRAWVEVVAAPRPTRRVLPPGAGTPKPVRLPSRRGVPCSHNSRARAVRGGSDADESAGSGWNVARAPPGARAARRRHPGEGRARADASRGAQRAPGDDPPRRLVPGGARAQPRPRDRRGALAGGSPQRLPHARPRVRRGEPARRPPRVREARRAALPALEVAADLPLLLRGRPAHLRADRAKLRGDLHLRGGVGDRGGLPHDLWLARARDRGLRRRRREGRGDEVPHPRPRPLRVRLQLGERRRRARSRTTDGKVCFGLRGEVAFARPEMGIECPEVGRGRTRPRRSSTVRIAWTLSVRISGSR